MLHGFGFYSVQGLTVMIFTHLMSRSFTLEFDPFRLYKVLYTSGYEYR